MIDMAQKDILPAVNDYLLTLANTTLKTQKAFGITDKGTFEYKTAEALISLKAEAFTSLGKLIEVQKSASLIENTALRAKYYKDSVIPVMDELRLSCDRMENLTAGDYWPIPTYGDLLFGVR